MKHLYYILVGLTLGLTACSGQIGSDTYSMTPPVTQGVPPPPVIPSSSPRPTETTATPSALPNTTPFRASANLTNSMRCPEINGYSCILHFVAPASIPSPKPSISMITQTSQPSASIPTLPTLTTDSSITLALETQPHNIPTNPNSHFISTDALVVLHVVANNDIIFNNSDSIDFILPQNQILNRNFAVQLFREIIGSHNRRIDTLVGSYSNSTISNTTLHFAITPSQITNKHGETWLFVLYDSAIPNTST